MIIKKLLGSLLYIILVILIVLSVYFLGFSIILKSSLNILSIFYSIVDFVKISVDTFLIFYSNNSVYYLNENFSVNTFSNNGFRHIYNEINFSKIILNWYFYSKFFFGTYYLNIDKHNVMNFKPHFSLMLIDITKYSQLPSFKGYSSSETIYDGAILLDYYWGSLRYRVNEGDLTLIPTECYERMVWPLTKRFLKYTVWMSGVYIYIPSWSSYENFFNQLLYNPFNYGFIYLKHIIFPILKYKFVITFLLFILLSRGIIYVHFITKYISGNVMLRNIYSFNKMFPRIFIVFLVFSLLTFFNWRTYLFIVLILFITFYFSFIYLMSANFPLSNRLYPFWFKKNLLIINKVRIYILSKIKTKKYRIIRKKYKRIIYRLFLFSLYIKKFFRYYFFYNYYYYFRLKKPFKKTIRWQLYYNIWDINVSSSLVNPLKYGEMAIPLVLKGSRGGLWVRTTQKTYAKHLMYENKNGLWFFRHKDYYDVWDFSQEFGLHFYDQRELLFLNSDNFFLQFFEGSKKIFSAVYNKARIIGGVNHYDIYHKFITASDVHTYMKFFKLGLLQRSIGLIIYRVYMRLAPKIVDIVYLWYSLVLNRLILINFFISGWFRAQVELTSFNIDTEYIPYLRYVEFYKLPGYLFFDYYLTKKAPYLTLDNRRHNQVYAFKELDGWIMRYKFFELKPEAYFVINGGLQRGITSFVPLLALKLSKWTLLFYRHTPFEYLIFMFVSILSHIWIFNKIFVIFDTYIYRCMHPSIWAKRKLIFNTTRVRFHHGMLRSRWLKNRRLMRKLKSGKYVHTRYNTLDDNVLF